MATYPAEAHHASQDLLKPDVVNEVIFACSGALIFATLSLIGVSQIVVLLIVAAS